MKVGVLTFHRASNYGTALQAFATVEALRSLGFDAELMDYRPEYTERTLRPRYLKKAKSPKEVASILINRLVYGNQPNEKIHRFLEYINELPCSQNSCKTVQELEAVAKSYDVILSGSDQLWNPRITGDDLAYFFPFPHPNKVSYGSSFGERSVSKDRQALLSPLLKQFRVMGLREETALQLTRQMVGDDYAGKLCRVIDPTLLLEAEAWKKHRNTSVKLPEGGYILTYYMIETPILRAITEKLRKETGLPVVNIKPSKRQILLHEGHNMMWAGPREFLSCYAGAKYVVTNSFHGTAFAINFEVPMYVAPLPVSMAGEVNSRLVDILDWYDLSDRWIENEDAVQKIDLRATMDNLKQISRINREESLQKLKEMLLC